MSRNFEAAVDIPEQDLGVTQYTGYVPRSPVEFDFVNKNETDNDQAGIDSDEGATAGQGAGGPSGKIVALVLVGVFVVAFIVTIGFSIFGAECKLSLCGKRDHSSSTDAKYKSTLHPFVAPLRYAWAAFAVSMLGIAMFGLYSFLLFKFDVIAGNMRALSLLIQSGANAFLVKQLWLVPAVVAVVLTLFGIGGLWRAAGCFLVGTLFGGVVAWVVAAMTSRGGLRTASATQDSIRQGMLTALRAGSTISIFVVSLGIGGLSFVYLVFQDVRALTGFVVGMTYISMLTRVSGGMYKKTSHVIADPAHERWFVDQNKGNPLTTACCIGDIVGSASGMAVDIMGSLVAAIVATAILGAYAPYFNDNPYAICMYNHLNLDKTCTIYDERGSKVSLAATVCRLEGFYKEYPSLGTWQSNPLLVALPFILGVVVVLTSGVCCFQFFVETTDEVPQSAELRMKTSKSMTRRLGLNVALCCLLMVVCTGGICWGLFGASSQFRDAQARLLQRYELPPLNSDNADTRCQPDQRGDGTTRTRLPRLITVEEVYNPISVFGEEYPSASQVPWRLFLCVTLGCVFGIVLGVVVERCNEMVRLPSKERANALDRGRGALTSNALGMGMVSATGPVAVLVTVMSVSFRLFGTYGVGLSSIGVLSAIGPIVAFESQSSITNMAKSVAQAPQVPRATWRAADFVNLVASNINAISRGVIAGSAFLSSFALTSVLVLESGLVPSPKQLAGTVDRTPSNHIRDFQGIDMVDLYVLMSTVLGILLPFLVAAFVLLSGNEAAIIMMAKVKENFNDFMIPWRADDVDRDAYGRYANLSSSSGVMNTVIPVVLAVMGPLVVGFGFGRRALISFTIGAVSSSFVLSTALSNTGWSLLNLRRYVEGSKNGSSSGIRDWNDATRTGETFGQSLVDCCSPALIALMKFVSAAALPIIPLPSPDIQRGWIGIILLCVMIFLLSLAVLKLRGWKRSVAPDLAEDGEIFNDGEPPKPAINAQFVSPFYEDGPYLGTERMHPRSNLAIASEDLEAVGFGGRAGVDSWIPMFSNDSKGRHGADVGAEDQLSDRGVQGNDGNVEPPLGEEASAQHTVVNI